MKNINLQPLKFVVSWDTKRILAYKNSINAHLSRAERDGCLDCCYTNCCCADIEKAKKGNDEHIEKLKLYKDELKKILAGRENLKK